ncbi:Quaternary ammonium compound-resistance protein SugE [Novipirellula aureliae]|uniref:Guanidinium exporter n=2 Tax=Novipirellula aureliae TaxID=2527966 RepID=A0A5C6DHP3_9BACT|nr:Quaternary ammonium compound-resistance protein SugE [Novipirellula aureliae]
MGTEYFLEVSNHHLQLEGKNRCHPSSDRFSLPIALPPLDSRLGKRVAWASCPRIGCGWKPQPRQILTLILRCDKALAYLSELGNAPRLKGVYDVPDETRRTRLRQDDAFFLTFLGSVVMNVWFILLLAGLLEIAWAIGLKYSDAFTRFWPSVWTVLAYIASILLLSLAVRQIPIGTAYPVWMGIGALGTAVFGIVFLGESTSLWRLLFLMLLVISLAGLKLSSEV